jgi:hypothetical protein
MQTYFGKIEVPITTVNAIVVSGGGSMQSQYVNADGEVVKTSEPMSYYVTQELKKWSKGTVVVEYGGEARFANVKGLFIKAQLDKSRKNSAVVNTVNVQPQQTVTPQQVVNVAPVTPVQTVPVQNSTPVQV